MKARGFWQLDEVSDERLVAGLRELLLAEGRSEARIVAHLAEVDARRIHLKGASPSLFEYCQKQLGLSDCQAYYRIVASRVGQKFPVVFELLERRQIHLTNIAPLAKHLTTENHLELLGEAGRLSKRELLRWLARRYPQPEVASGMRKLPARQLVPKPGSVSAGPTGSLEPRSEAHYRLQLNMPEWVKAKLELARDLMSHANPSGDLVAVVERGLDLLIAQLQKTRFGQTSRPRKQQPPRTRPLATSKDLDRSKSVGTSTPSSRPQSAQKARSHIPRERKRQLVARDGLCCSYVGDDGVRCTARAFLQIDHQQPWAKGGGDTLDNLRLLCRAHNLLLAEADFGKMHVHLAIARQRQRSQT
jgi:5-methylcytosine-specific restriction endonuclease McrA